MKVDLNINAKALLNPYTKSLTFVYMDSEKQTKQETYEPQKEQPVLYEDKDGKVVVKGVSNSEEKPIKR